jgi:hypothetical protein
MLTYGASDEEFGDFVSDASFADFSGVSAAGAALSLSTAFPNLSGAIPNHAAAASDELDADFGAFDGPATSAVAAVTGVGEEVWGGLGADGVLRGTLGDGGGAGHALGRGEGGLSAGEIDKRIEEKIEKGGVYWYRDSRDGVEKQVEVVSVDRSVCFS